MGFVLYTKPNCNMCGVAKQTFKNRDVPYDEISVGTDIERSEFISKFPHVRGFPLVTYETSTGEVWEVGGPKALVRYLDENGM